MDTPEELRDLLESALQNNAEGKKSAKELNALLKKERDTVLSLARSLECADCEEILLGYLQSEKEAWQKLGIELVRRMRRPTLPLLEPVADVSRLPGAKEALLRFPRERVKNELQSLIRSRNEEERIVGLELARNFGDSAKEYAQLIAEVFAQDLNEGSSLAAVHTLAALLPQKQLATALTPALDHWNQAVQKEAKRYLQEADVPIRESIWENHPFSQGLRVQLQRLGFVPKGFEIPEKRPLPARPFEWQNTVKEEEQLKKAIASQQLSKAVWALLNALKYPPYHLYTVWGSYEDSQTFHFSSEDPIYVVQIGKVRHLMHVIGDGSIGYFATIDLLDDSDDPPVYYIERWGGEGWRVSWALSAYLRSLGNRSST